MTFEQHLYVETLAKQFHVNKTSMTPMAVKVKPLSDGQKPPKKRRKCALFRTGRHCGAWTIILEAINDGVTISLEAKEPGQHVR